MSTVGLAVVSLVIALATVPAYLLLLGVPLVRNHPEGYVAALALAAVVAVAAVARGHGRRWPAWIALVVSTGLLVLGSWFNFVVARVPATPPAVRVGETPPDFTLPDARGRPVSLGDYRGHKPVVLVFYRGYW